LLNHRMMGTRLVGQDQLFSDARDFERSFTRMLENMALASAMINAQGKIVFINTYLLELTGWKRQEVMGRDWIDTFIPPERRDKQRNTFELVRCAIVEISPYIESEVITKDGKRIPIAWNNTLMKDADGNFVGVSSIGENLSQRNLPMQTATTATTCNDAHDHDHTCTLLENYETTKPAQTSSNSVAGDTMGDLVLVKVLKNLAGDKGNVQLAIHKDTKQKVAVKSLRKDLMKPEEIERARREIEIMQQLRKLNNPYIIKLLGYEETATHFNLLIEYLSGGELVSLILENKGLKEDHAHRLFKQLVCAINTCHQNSVVHRDIKLQNIMLDEDGNIRLIDFGLSNFVEAGRFRSTFCGTPAYAPPEILLGTQYKGPEVDVWSLGVVLYSMLTGEFPFTTIAEILKGKFNEPTENSAECMDLLKRMLTVKKEARATLPEVMNHPWLSKSPGSCSNGVKRESSEAQEPESKRQRRSSIAIELPIS